MCSIFNFNHTQINRTIKRDLAADVDGLIPRSRTVAEFATVGVNLDQAVEQYREWHGFLRQAMPRQESAKSNL